MLCNCLSAAERTGDCRNTALRYGEHCVYHTLTGYERFVGRELFGIRSALSHRPFLHKGKFPHAVFCFNGIHGIGNGILTAGNALNRSLNSVGNHNFVIYYFRFFNCAHNVAGNHFITDGYAGVKVPFYVPFKRRHFNATFEVVAAYCHNTVERTLNTVKDTAYNSGAEFNAQRLVGGLDILAGSEARCFLIYLNTCPVAVHFYNFAD